MKNGFQGWAEVARRLRQWAGIERERAATGKAAWLNDGQCASLEAIAERVVDHGLIIADEVGMGKTRIAVALISAVVGAGGRVAVLVPPVLGYQWQDELREGGAAAPQILRSLWQYLQAWSDEDASLNRPWFEASVVLLSHAFADWRLGAASQPWRWAMLPEVYCQWRRRVSASGRLPRGYHGMDRRYAPEQQAQRAARAVVTAIPADEDEPAWQAIKALAGLTPWPGALDAAAYSKDEALRPCLEQAVGLGLGLFDLVVVDEAHKSRGEDSRLSTLLDRIILTTPEARRFGMTATPVELDVSQWNSILARVGLDEARLRQISEHVNAYARIVAGLRHTPTDASLQAQFRERADRFEQALSPYVIRRDKREDDAVRRFTEAAGDALDDYRVLRDIRIDIERLSPAWQQVVCAAEALSQVSRGGQGGHQERLKRLRLTMGNGHGLAALIDAPFAGREDENAAAVTGEILAEDAPSRSDEAGAKRRARARWWSGVMQAPFAGQNGDEAIFNHPAILETVREIEQVLSKGEKVLVFGCFTRPLRRLTELLNARALLRALQHGDPWPQEKVHGGWDGSADESDWPALRAAHAQLKCPLPIDAVEGRLREQYAAVQAARERFRRGLLGALAVGFDKSDPQRGSSRKRARMLFEAFRNEVLAEQAAGHESRALSSVSRALEELLSPRLRDVADPASHADAFEALLQALSERDEGDRDNDGQLDPDEAAALWPILRQRLEDDYSSLRGGLARLMYGGTSPHSRRMMQLAFNRPHSSTRVLVAQSRVGREGLNLHQACRTVVLLHPEWNPGVVEQQIGRVDRVGSQWERMLDAALARGEVGDGLPRIEIRPVVFSGTYDEHNWQVLRERWSDLRAQLHGTVLTAEVADDPLMAGIVRSINAAAPNFSPSRRKC